MLEIAQIARQGQAAVSRALPRGGTLPEADWERRHRVLVWSTWACLPILLVYSAAEGYPAWHTAAHVSAIVPLALLAGLQRLGRKERTAAVSLALLTVCALLIHMSGGLIEMHFSFFVVIVVLTIYEEIPLASRIVSVCDAYDAMISERPYGVARPKEDALAELARCAGTQFDPAVVAAFSAVLRDFDRAEPTLA